MSQVTVIAGADRRRMWTAEQKRALVLAACEPGASVVEVAPRADLRASQIYRRREMSRRVPGFAAVTATPEPQRRCERCDAVVVEFGGAVVRIAAGASPGAAVMRSLAR
jgi:transposase